MRSWRPALVLAMVLAAAANGLAQDDASGAPSKPHPVPMTPAQKARPASPDFGTAQEHYVRIGGSEFVPDGASAAGWQSTWDPGSAVYAWRGYFFSNVNKHVYAWVHAPGGALLTYVELDFCNADATHDLTMNLYACDFSGSCGSTPIATMIGAAGAGCAAYYVSGIGGVTVDNYLGEYLLDVVWPTGSPNTSAISLAGAIVGWKYQVAPAPVTATFPDVPTSDPGFQYVEALVASGITAGCGGGNYCPDNPLTRRQMAIFLSKALGLYWGGY